MKTIQFTYKNQKTQKIQNIMETLQFSIDLWENHTTATYKISINFTKKNFVEFVGFLKCRITNCRVLLIFGILKPYKLLIKTISETLQFG